MESLPPSMRQSGNLTLQIWSSRGNLLNINPLKYVGRSGKNEFQSQHGEDESHPMRSPDQWMFLISCYFLYVFLYSYMTNTKATRRQTNFHEYWQLFRIWSTSTCNDSFPIWIWIQLFLKSPTESVNMLNWKSDYSIAISYDLRTLILSFHYKLSSWKKYYITHSIKSHTVYFRLFKFWSISPFLNNIWISFWLFLSAFKCLVSFIYKTHTIFFHWANCLLVCIIIIWDANICYTFTKKKYFRSFRKFAPLPFVIQPNRRLCAFRDLHPKGFSNRVLRLYRIFATSVGFLEADHL